MGLFCTCAHDNFKHAELLSEIHSLKRRIEYLEFFKRGITDGSIAMYTTEGKFALRKVEEETKTIMCDECYDKNVWVRVKKGKCYPRCFDWIKE